MKKLFIRSIAAIIAAVSFWGSAYAQEIPQLPVDPALRYGVLDNGMSYYIRHNETPKGQADFFIAQKVGSILENEDQRGLAHFLEHMCFNGTENFPGKGIINWLETKGVKFGQNLNAYTGVDETVYNISNVPITGTAVQDSCLLILHDWSCAVTLDPAEIDAERGVIHEEWRQSMVGEMRVLERLLPTIYPDSKYAYCLPIGTMEVVDNFPPQAIVDYYHTWYRPDQQGIIVVGDIDVDYIEGKIKEIFSPIPMPENPKEREYFTVDETPGTIYAIGSDPEIQSPEIELIFKTDALLVPREYRNTEAFLSTQYIRSMIMSMMNSRLADLANKPDTEYARARLSIGDFFLAKTMGALDLDVVPKDTDFIPAFTQAYRELMRAIKGGFTIGEYDRAKAAFLSRIDKQYQERDHRQNEAFSREYVRFFIDNNATPGLEALKEIYEKYAQLITVDQINKILPALVNEDNRILLALFPETEAYKTPTEEQFEKAIAAVDAEELEPYKDEMREDPLIPSLPAPGSIKSVLHNSEWDAEEFVLSNGVKVIVKKTDFKPNEIQFSAIAKGNAMSTLDPSLASSVRFFPVAMSIEALNDYSNSDIRKYLQGKQVEYEFAFDSYTRNLEGNTTVADLPTAMELLYSFFTGFNLNEEEFEARRGATAGIYANMETNPQFIFQKTFLKALFNNPMRQALTLDDIKAADRSQIVDIVKKMTANAADYTFAFVGDIDIDTFKPLMEQYIATLPANAATASKSFRYDPNYEVSLSNDDVHATTKMETPQSWILITLTGNMPYTVENRVICQVASQVLSKRLLEKVREEMGATYSIGAASVMSRAGYNNTLFQIGFPMKPEMKDEALAAIRKIVDEMATNVTEAEIKPAIEFMQKEDREDLVTNEDWAGSITATSINGVQTFLTTGEALKTITPEAVMSFMARLLYQGHYRVIVLDPEEVEVAGN